jgi:hypothetical protein
MSNYTGPLHCNNCHTSKSFYQITPMECKEVLDENGENCDTGYHETGEPYLECINCGSQDIETDYDLDYRPCLVCHPEEDNGRLWSDEVLGAYDQVEVDGVTVAYSRHVDLEG